MSLRCSQAHVSAPHSCFMQGSYLHTTGIINDSFEMGISWLPPETGWAACTLRQQAHTQNLGGGHYDEASLDLKIVGNDCSTLDQSTWRRGAEVI